MTDRRTDGRTDRRTGKNNMSPDPVWGRHNKVLPKGLKCTFIKTFGRDDRIKFAKDKNTRRLHAFRTSTRLKCELGYGHNAKARKSLRDDVSFARKVLCEKRGYMFIAF